MSIVDLNKFSDQIEKLEHANRATASQALLIAPRHHHHQPVHVMYGGAHLLNENTFSRISEIARESFNFGAKDSRSLNVLCAEDWSDDFSQQVFDRVKRKLSTEPLEDYRIDFEDGYGVRSDEDEDQHAKAAAMTLAKLGQAQKTPRHVGFRIKPLSITAMRRSLRTLSLFVTEFAAHFDKSSAIKRLMVALPKVTNAEQVATLVEILLSYEQEFQLEHGFFGVELIIESPEAFLSLDGSIPLPSFLHSAAGRCQSLHFGVYDFTSSLGIGSAGQSIDHLACDFARMWMQLVAGLAPGLGLSDGIISRLPIVPKESTAESVSNFQNIWRYNYQQMMRSLANGFSQGWDLHPSQLSIRHVANHVFVLRELDMAVTRLKTFSEKASQASHVGGVFDDRASVLGLINFFDRAITSGVLTHREIHARGIDLAAVRASI